VNLFMHLSLSLSLSLSRGVRVRGVLDLCFLFAWISFYKELRMTKTFMITSGKLRRPI
jgi:hypothetical protein